MRRLLVLTLLAIVPPAGADSPSPATVPVSPLLRQLDGEVREACRKTGEGIVRVHLPARAVDPSAELMRKWERRLNPDVRQRLSDEALAHRAPTTDAATRPASAGPHAGAPRGEFVTVGLVIDDAGLLLVPAYLDKAHLTDPLPVTTPGGDTLQATIIAADRPTGVTLMRTSRPTGRALTLATARPTAGALLIALCGDDTRLMVWTGMSRESGVVITPDGAVGVLRAGRFLGGPGYATLVRQLRDDGAARRAWVGMKVAELTPPEQARLAPLRVVERPGLQALIVDPDSPAARAGVRAGDLLLAVGGHEVPDLSAIAAVLTEVRGPTALTLGRDDRRVEVVVEPQATEAGK